MDVFNKFYSTVSTTVSQLQGVLPGNPVTREYEVIAHVASAGSGLQWKIYSGYKKSTRQEASIFVFEKRQLERWTKQDKDNILGSLKRGAAQLTRLRHPQILVVHHPCEESRDSLAFATEPVFASLANILGKSENTPVPPNPQLKNYTLFEVEIKYGLLQVGEGLAFLHNDAKILHHNLTPENIIVNQQGAWKIFGFDTCILNAQPSGATASPLQDNYDLAIVCMSGPPLSCMSQAVWPWEQYKPDVHPLAQPDLDYLAPESVWSQVNDAPSDMYSLSVVITTLYNDGQPLFSSNNDWLTYKRNINELKQLPLSRLMCVAEGLRDMVRLMLNVKPELRPDEHEFMKIDFFNDVGVKTLNYLDSLFQWDNLQKSQFYKGLPEITEKLPHRVSVYRIIPCLVKEFINPTMVPFVLPNVLLIAESCTKEEFCQYILPHLKPVMKMTDPVQILLIFMQKMELLLKLCTCEDVKSDVLPMLYRALETDAQQIQELCLSVLPTYASLIEYPAMKNALLPRIKRLCISTSFISVRVNCLVCLGKLLEHLDKWLVLDEVLPFLPQIPSREPAVLMGILGIYKLVLNHKKMNISKEIMATKIIPFLMPLSIENALTLNQFNAIIAVIKDMINKVENEHRVKLDQLNSIQNEQKILDANMTSQFSSAPPSKMEFEEILGMMPQSTNNPTMTVNKDISSLTQPALTLQDKQEFIQKQETAKRLRQEPVLNPVLVIPKAPPAVKDLTKSLIENNLKQMSVSGPSIPSATWSLPLSVAPTIPIATVTATPAQAWSSQSWGPTAHRPPPTQLSFPAPQFQKTTNKVPMGSLVNQPTYQNSIMSSMKPAQSTKPLSSSEINDFLS